MQDSVSLSCTRGRKRTTTSQHSAHLQRDWAQQDGFSISHFLFLKHKSDGVLETRNMLAGKRHRLCDKALDDLLLAVESPEAIARNRLD